MEVKKPGKLCGQRLNDSNIAVWDIEIEFRTNHQKSDEQILTSSRALPFLINSMHF